MRNKYFPFESADAKEKFAFFKTDKKFVSLNFLQFRKNTFFGLRRETKDLIKVDLNLRQLLNLVSVEEGP